MSEFLYKQKKEEQNKVIQISNVVFIGNPSKKVIIAGPCAIKSKQQLLDTARILKAKGVNIMRAGAFKPRTSPYSFQGLEEEGLNILIEVKKEIGIPVITEITDEKHLLKFIENIDIIQVGSKNMFNYELLKKLGKTNKPILLKRAMSATYKEWLLAAEYIMSFGNENVILCERGIRTFETETRNTLDIQAIPYIKKNSRLPIIVDPSHACGNRYMIRPLALAAIISGADGIMIESELYPEEAVSDKEQTIDIDELSKIINNVEQISNLLI